MRVASVRGNEIICSWCDVCQVYKPPRSFHCRHCKCCVQVFDHHCMFLGVCIGKRNLFYYYTFELWTLIHSIFALTLQLVVIVNQDYKSNWLIWGLAALTALITLMMLFLFCRQT